MKLDELAKLKKRKVKDKSMSEAREALNLGDTYLKAGKMQEAMQ